MISLRYQYLSNTFDVTFLKVHNAAATWLRFYMNSVYKFSQDNESWSAHRLGYLSEVDWSYLLALYRYARKVKTQNSL